MTTHHIDYDKTNCSPQNLIALCSACNSKANFNRPHWQQFYEQIVKARAKKYGGGWEMVEF